MLHFSRGAVVVETTLGRKNIRLVIEVLMNTEMTAAHLTPYIETAEKAVATVKDPRLREIAFGRILDHLLASKKPDPVKSNHAATKKLGREKREAKAAPTGVTAWLRELVDEGFFSEPRFMKE